MVADNGPKDGDFASYVESLSRTQNHSRGQAHPATPAVHDLHDDALSPQARPDSSGALSQTGAPRDPIRDPMFHASGKPSRSSRAEVLGSIFAAPTRPAKSAVPDLLRAGRWALRIVALILIAVGIFAVPFSVFPIALGVLLLSLSQARSRNDRSS